MKVQKALAPQTASSLPYYQFSKRKMTARLGSRWRSFFLFVVTVRNSPCDLKGNVDCPAEKREQKHDLFKRHGDPPFPPLGIRGGRDLQEKIAFVRCLGTGKGYPPAFVGAAPDDGVSAAEPAYHKLVQITIGFSRSCQTAALDNGRWNVYNESTKGAGPANG